MPMAVIHAFRYRRSRDQAANIDAAKSVEPEVEPVCWLWVNGTDGLNGYNPKETERDSGMK